MSTSTLAVETRAVQSLGRWKDYVELTRPRISVLVLVVVAAAAYVASWGQLDPWLMMHALLGTAWVAASASSLNQWLEREGDARMERTSDRPLPSGRMSANQVMGFAVVTLVLGLAQLAWQVNLLTALLGLATWAIYGFAYTPLKTRTPHNTLVGAVSGALPVWMGWAAVSTTQLPWQDVRALSLLTLLFLWQFPHFMAIAWIYRDQYRQAGIRMWTVVDPTGRRAAVQAVLGALALLPISFVPALYLPVSMAGYYLLAAFALGLVQLAFAVRFFVCLNNQTARGLLRATLVYLPALLVVLVVVTLVP
ncbi:MAG: heme o synthase [Pirellulaceae bacterium]